MAFKIVEKSMGTSGISKTELSVNNYGVSFGKDISDKFNEFTHCEVYLDKDKRKVGLKPTNNSLTGFKVSFDNNGKGRKSISGAWVKRIPSKRFTPTYEDDMIIINDCDIADKLNK